MSSVFSDAFVQELAGDVAQKTYAMIEEKIKKTLLSQWMTLAEAAEYVRYDEKTFKNLVCKGKFRVHKVGGTGRPRFNRFELDEDLLRDGGK
jgi:excisionase family DNA binding protein